jgi:arylformamidase
MTVLYDLSAPLHEDTPVWPGDVPFTSRWTARLGADSAINLAEVRATVHLGTHADAALHTEERGAAIDAMPLDAYLGACVVVAVATAGERELLGRADLAPLDRLREQAPRLLIRTGCVDGSRGFPSRWSALDPELARAIAGAGFVLVGTDAPSVDPLTSTALESHHALLGRGVAILENLRLEGVTPGVYELVALPLRLRGLDASPVRAVLRALHEDR